MRRRDFLRSLAAGTVGALLGVQPRQVDGPSSGDHLRDAFDAVMAGMLDKPRPLRIYATAEEADRLKRAYQVECMDERGRRYTDVIELHSLQRDGKVGLVYGIEVFDTSECEWTVTEEGPCDT